jgi:hypothetical protein
MPATIIPATPGFDVVHICGTDRALSDKENLEHFIAGHLDGVPIIAWHFETDTKPEAPTPITVDGPPEPTVSIWAIRDDKGRIHNVSNCAFASTKEWLQHLINAQMSRERLSEQLTGIVEPMPANDERTE